MGSVVGDRLGWPVADPRRAFIGDLWTTVLTIANVAPHPEGSPDPQVFSAPETRLLFRLVALLSEFLADVTNQ
jgi:hypothetical protein